MDTSDDEEFQSADEGELTDDGLKPHFDENTFAMQCDAMGKEKNDSASCSSVLLQNIKKVERAHQVPESLISTDNVTSAYVKNEHTLEPPQRAGTSRITAKGVITPTIDTSHIAPSEQRKKNASKVITSMYPNLENRDGRDKLSGKLKSASLSDDSGYQKKQDKDNSLRYNDRGSKASAEKSSSIFAGRTFNFDNLLPHSENNKHNWPWLDSLFSSASSTVTNIKSSVGEGLTAVLETVDSKLGAPDPKELVRMNMLEAEVKGEAAEEPALIRTGLGAVLDSVESCFTDSDPKEVAEMDRLVEEVKGESTSEGEEDQSDSASISNSWFSLKSLTNKIVSSGLDVLETVGRKTMTVIQDKELITPSMKKLTLSDAIHEARNRADLRGYDKKIPGPDDFLLNSSFDSNDGRAHYESLLSLSKHYQVLLEGEARKILYSDEISKIFTGDEQIDADAYQSIMECLDELLSLRKTCLIPLDLKDIVKIAGDVQDFISWNETEDTELKSIAEDFSKYMGKYCASVIAFYHKAAACLLTSSFITFENICDQFVILRRISSLLCCLLELFSQKCAFLLQAKSVRCSRSAVSEIISDMFYEESSHLSFIQENFDLLQPICVYRCISLEKEANT